LGRLQDALSLYAVAEPVLRVDGSPLHHANCQLNYAYCLDLLDRSAEALPLFEAAETVFRNRQMPEIQARCLMGHASCLLALGRAKDALPLFQAAGPALETYGTPANHALWRMNYANCLYELGREEEALPLYEAAGPALQAHGTLSQRANCLMNHAHCLEALGRPVDALSLYASAEEALSTAGRPREHARSQVSYANCLAAVGRTREALPLYEIARTSVQAHATPVELASYYMGLANCLRELGRSAEALPLLEVAEPVFQAHATPAQHARCKENQAGCLHELGRAAEALPLYETAELLLQAHSTPPDYARCQMNHASCLRDLGRPEEAESRYKAVVRLCNELGTQEDQLRWAAEFNWAVLLYQLGTKHEAAAHLEIALAVVERLSQSTIRLEDRVGLRGTHAKVYWLAVHQSLLDDDAQAAFRHAQQAKGRTLADLIEHRAQPEPSDQREREISRISWEEYRIATHPQDGGADRGPDRDSSAQLRDLRQQQAELVTQLAEQQPERALLSHGRVRDLSEIQAVLQPGEAFLDFLDMGTDVAVFLVTPADGLVHAEVLGGTELWDLLDNLTSEFLSTVEVAKHGVVREVTALKALYESLIRPIGKLGPLGGVKRLFISPSGRLHLVPFPALWYEVEDVGRGPIRYLYEDLEICGIPTATSLWLLRTQRTSFRGPLTLVAVAPFASTEAPSVVKGDGDGIGVATNQRVRDEQEERPPELPETGREAREVAKVVEANGGTAAVLLGDRATLERTLALAPGAVWLLMATHGGLEAAGDELLDFRLLFNPGPESSTVGDFEKLPVWEIYRGRLRLPHGSQVSLTACDLGLPMLSGGEAIGFNQALLSAGASLSLAPLWPVDDLATADLSIAYHRALLSPDRPPATKAMQHAMDDVRARRGWEHPYYWAAFLPSGDGALRFTEV
jgi:CHAT domain-containing protein